MSSFEAQVSPATDQKLIKHYFYEPLKLSSSWIMLKVMLYAQILLLQQL